MGVKTENKMAYEPVNKLIIQMSAPPLISMFFQYSYNLVDSMFVAGINEQALAAVSLAFPITTLMNALSVWIGVGVNVLIAGYLGQKNQQKANSAAALGVVISVVVGVLINFLSLFIINPYYSAFTQNKEIFEYGIAYMSVCVFYADTKYGAYCNSKNTSGNRQYDCSDVVSNCRCCIQFCV